MFDECADDDEHHHHEHGLEWIAGQESVEPGLEAQACRDEGLVSGERELEGVEPMPRLDKFWPGQSPGLHLGFKLSPFRTSRGSPLFRLLDPILIPGLERLPLERHLDDRK